MAYLSETKGKLVDFSGGGVRFTGHSHRSEYELILVLDGKIGLQTERKRYFHLSREDCVLIPPGKFHWMWNEQDPGVYFNFLLQGDLTVLAQVSGAGPFSLTSLGSYLFILRDRLKGEGRKFGMLKDEFYFLWTAGLLERIDTLRIHENPLSMPSGGNFEQRIRRIMADMIEGSPSERPTVGELASRLGLERSYLTRKIKTFTGLSLMDMYYQELFSQARLLIEGGASVKEGAYYYGFANPYHFSRKFKEVTGVTPSECKGA